MADLQSDNSLANQLEAIGRGQKSRIRDLYDATCKRLFAVCLAILIEREAAEDVLQDVYVRISDRADSFDRATESSWRWLIGIAREVALERAQSRSGGDVFGARRASTVEDGTVGSARGLEADRDVLAGGLALGVLEGEERAEAERLRLQDAEFAAAVARWEVSGEPGGERLGAPEPSASVWREIKAGLDRNDAPVPVQERYLEAHEVSEPAQSSFAWKALAFFASLAALVFALMWLLDEPDRISVPIEVPVEGQFDPARLSVAQINGAEADTLLSALYDRQTGKLYLRLAQMPDSGRMPQLWLIDEAGSARSLGFGGRGSVKDLQLTPDQQEIAAGGGAIAISLEEPSPTPADMPGQIVGTAKLTPFNGVTRPT